MRELNPYNTSLTVAGTEAPPEQQRAAAVTCAAHATSPEELVELLDMLGILEDVPA